MSGFAGAVSHGKSAVTFTVGVGELNLGGGTFIRGFVDGQQGTLSPTTYYSKAVQAIAINTDNADFGVNIEATGVSRLFQSIDAQDSAGGTRSFTSSSATFTPSSVTVDGVLCDTWTWGTGSNPVWTTQHLSRTVVIK